MKKPWFPPFLVSLWYVISRMVYGIFYYHPGTIILFFLVIIGFSTGSYLLFNRIYRDHSKASLFTTIFLFLNYFFSYVSAQVQAKIFGPFALDETFDIYFFAGCAIGSGIIFFWLRKTRKNLMNTVFLFSAVLISLNVYQLYSVITRLLKDISPQQVNASSGNHASAKPNIYYIVADSYTSDNSLSKYWNYANSDFHNFLQEKGFNTTTEAKATFTSTPFCISSYLNMANLNMNSNDTKVNMFAVAELLRDNRVTHDFLKQYHLINYSTFDIGETRKDYAYINVARLFGNTLWTTLENWYIKVFTKQGDQMPQYNFKLIQKTAEVEADSGPKFIYTHLMMPHVPFLYVDDEKLESEKNSKEEMHFLAQVKTTNALLKYLFETILKKDPSCIIVFQADHGYRSLQSAGPEARIDESRSIQNAIYLGGQKIDTTILNNPVNNFRVVMNEVFDAGIPYE